MKKSILSIIFTLVLLLSVFTGCSGETENSPGKTDNSVQSGANDIVSENNDPAAGTEELGPAPDYSDFAMPEETDKLVVYIGEFANFLHFFIVI